MCINTVITLRFFDLSRIRYFLYAEIIGCFDNQFETDCASTCYSYGSPSIRVIVKNVASTNYFRPRCHIDRHFFIWVLYMSLLVYGYMGYRVDLNRGFYLCSMIETSQYVHSFFLPSKMRNIY